MQINIGFSPCPNDTFIFYALVHGKIDTAGIQFKPFLADVEKLNQMAVAAELPVTKISYNAYLDLTASYALLDSGGALGRDCGPLLIASEERSVASLEGKKVAIPGEKTTANFLLDYFLPFPVKKVVMTFNEIEDAVIDGKVEAGVIIHENRFTYADKGLVKLQDLGSFWERSTGAPIPLGGIIAQRSLGQNTIKRIDKMIRESLLYAQAHRDEVLPYIKSHAQEMDETVIWQHIDLYVNSYSISLGPEGKEAVEQLFTQAKVSGRIKDWTTPYLPD